MSDTGSGSDDDIERRIRELNEEIGRRHAREQKEQRRAARKHQRRGQRSQWIAAVVVVLLIAAGTGAYYLHGRSPAAAAGPAGHTRSPSAPPQLESPQPNGPPSDPFADSQAADWATGAAGIVLPSAGPHGPFTAAQVRAAYTTTRNLLIAQDLNWPTLEGGAPTAFEHLLPSWYQSQFLADLDKTGRAANGTLRTSRGYVTSFAPGSTQFVTQVVKVRGTMSAGTSTYSGSEVLKVSFVYVFAYAVEPPGKPGDWMRVVQQQYGYFDFEPSSMTDFQSFNMGFATGGGLCGVTDGYIHPSFPQGPPSTVQPSGPAQDPYSLATPQAGVGYTCHPTTGT
jgi:hypothetical protein